MILKLLRCQFLLTKLVKIHKIDNDLKVSINEAVWSNTSFLTLLAGRNESSCNLWRFAQCFYLQISPLILSSSTNPSYFHSRLLERFACICFLLFPHLSLDHTDLISGLIISLKHLLLGSPVAIFHLHLAEHFSSIRTKFLLKYFLTSTFRILCSLGFNLLL